MQYDDQPSGEAEYLLNHPLLQDIFGELEHEATEAAIETDNTVARDMLVREVRTIRNLRQKLKTLAEGKTTRPQQRAVA